LILFSFFSLFPRENKYFSRMSGTRVYVGHLSSRTRERDIEEAFSAYGRINRVDLKFGYGFVDFDDSRDAEDAVREMDGRNVDGERIIVEFARGDRRDDRSRRNPPPTEGRCFNCGKDGHWARDCPDEEGRCVSYTLEFLYFLSSNSTCDICDARSFPIVYRNVHRALRMGMGSIFITVSIYVSLYMFL